MELIAKEDRMLLGTSDKAIEESSMVFCFDYDNFKARIHQGERWQQLIVAHLYLEHVTSVLVSEEMKQPDALDLSRIAFSQRVGLAAALDLIPGELIPAIKVINRLRNQAAHRLDFVVEDKDVTDFLNVVPAQIKDAVLSSSGRIDQGPVSFREALFALVVQADIFRQDHMSKRQLERKAALRLRMVLDRRTDVKYVP